MILDGKKIAAEIRREVAADVALRPKGRRAPCLAVFQVGDDPASCVYVRNKQKACEEVGIRFLHVRQPESISRFSLEALLVHYSRDRDDVDAILLQLPVPGVVDESRLLDYIAPEKDADGLTSYHAALLQRGRASVAPCTPAGVMELLRRYHVPIEGKRCVVVGRSDIVGKPMANMLLNANGTVTICHSRTENLAEICREADILVSAVGKPRFITADMVKPGACVVDVGINRTGGKLCGDVDFAAVEPIAGYITPVPGGVGAMTVAMLLRNVVKLAKNAGW